MDAESISFLLTVAQVGIALAGFSSLISSFRRGDVALTPAELAGRSMILEMGLAATFFALLPSPIETLLRDIFSVDRGVWRISSALVLTFLIVWGLYNFNRAARVNMQGEQSTFNLIYNGLLLVISIFLALNILFFGSVSLYMLALIWMLAVAGVQFMMFVYVYARQRD